MKINFTNCVLSTRTKKTTVRSSFQFVEISFLFPYCNIRTQPLLRSISSSICCYDFSSLLFSSPVISSLHYPPLSSLHFSFLPRHLSSCPLFPTLPLSSLLFSSLPFRIISPLPYYYKISSSPLTSNPDG